MNYQSRGWRAVETPDLTGATVTLTVSGEVEVRKTNEVPLLREAEPQGIDPAILILDVIVEGATEIGGDVVVWKDARFSREVSARQYAQVTLRGAVEERTVDVERVQS